MMLDLDLFIEGIDEGVFLRLAVFHQILLVQSCFKTIGGVK